MKHDRVLIWFSCGVTSAVAGKITLKEFPDAEVLYCDPPDCDPFFCASTVERTGLCET